MEISELRHFRDILIERRELLTEWFKNPEANRAEETGLVRQLLEQIQDALKRIENETYGECEVCHGTVELHRLEVQPASFVCLECISEQEKSELEEDLFLASKIHRALLPQTIPAINGFEVELQSLAAGVVGGDFYDFMSGEGNSAIKIVVADAMGKGLPAGLLMSNLCGALRILAPQIDSPRMLMSRLNSWLCRSVPVTKFISLFCMELNRSDEDVSRITYTNAGHCPPILIRRDGTIERLGVTGGVLGVHEDFSYEEEGRDIYSGDMIALFTDGVVEAMNRYGEAFEEPRLIDYLGGKRDEPPVKIIADLVEEVRKFTGETRMEDDFTFILLKKR